MLGAAAVATPSLAGAVVGAPRADDTILSLKSVPLAWPQYHQISTFSETPNLGDAVTLVREDKAPFDDDAIAVYSANWKRIGYIPRRHTPALSWAMERGVARQAHITQIAEPVVRGQRVPGWGAFHIDVTVSAPAMV